MDRKELRLIRGIIVINIMVVAISIFLWTRYSSNMGVLITIISIWTSFFAVRVVMNRYGVCEYRFVGNSFIDGLIKKLIKW